MRLLPRAGAGRVAAITVLVVVALAGLIAFFEFVVNRHILPANF